MSEGITKEELELNRAYHLILYLEVLQKGRAKPDTRGGSGTIYESLENISNIAMVKEEINKILKVDNGQH